MCIVVCTRHLCVSWYVLGKSIGMYMYQGKSIGMYMYQGMLIGMYMYQDMLIGMYMYQGMLIGMYMYQGMLFTVPGVVPAVLGALSGIPPLH